MFTTKTIPMHEVHLEFEENDSKKSSERTDLKKSRFISDEEGHYDIDGVSFSSQGVIVASDAAILYELDGEYLSFVRRLSRYFVRPQEG